MAEETRLQALARVTPLGTGVAVATLASLAMIWWAPSVEAQSAHAPAAAATPTPGAVSMPARAPRTPSTGCLIGPERVADIGSPVTAVIASMKVDRGDAVGKGEPLVLLESDVERAGVQAAQTRAVVDAEIRAAEANLALTQQKLQRTQGLVAEGFVTAQAVDQARAERDVAEQRVAQARNQRMVQAHELGVMRAQLGQRTLRSPFAGVVTERYANAGERAEDKPLLRVAMLDPLRVELVVPASRWGSIARGDRMPIVPDLPGASAVLARVSHVDKVIDAASNTFRVRLSLPNPGHKLPAGARCRLDGPEAAPSPPAAAASASSARAMPAAALPVRPTADLLQDAAQRRPRLKITI